MVSDEVFRRDAGIRIFQMRNPKVRVYSKNYEKIGLCSWLEDLGAFPVDNLQLDPRRKWDFGDRKWRECTCLLETSDLDDRIKCLERINIMLFAAAGGEQEVITNYLQQICEAEIKTAKAIRDGYNPDEVYENFCSSLISGPSLVVNELIRLARTRGVGFVLGLNESELVKKQVEYIGVMNHFADEYVQNWAKKKKKMVQPMRLLHHLPVNKGNKMMK